MCKPTGDSYPRKAGRRNNVCQRRDKIRTQGQKAYHSTAADSGVIRTPSTMQNNRTYCPHKRAVEPRSVRCRAKKKCDDALALSLSVFSVRTLASISFLLSLCTSIPPSGHIIYSPFAWCLFLCVSKLLLWARVHLLSSLPSSFY